MPGWTPMKRKRRKRDRLTIDGEEVEDLDEWLLANANDITLHQMERWDLITRRDMEEQGTFTNEDTGANRRLALDFRQLEDAFEVLSMIDPGLPDGPSRPYLNLTTGEVVWPDDEHAFEVWSDDNLLALPEDLYDYGLPVTGFDDLLAWIEPGPVRKALTKVRGGKGFFRRCKDVIFGSGSVEARDAWHRFDSQRLREQITQWLESYRITPVWDPAELEPPERPDKRPDLLRAVARFVRAARDLKGVKRVALLGSLTTPEPFPKDVDLLVEFEGDHRLDGLARSARRLLGQAAQTGDSCGADVFLCDSDGAYLGRMCPYKRCAPGVRQSCRARNCGQREFLCDDLQVITLEPELIAEPPLDLWPAVKARVELPSDVATILVEPMLAEQPGPW